MRSVSARALRAFYAADGDEHVITLLRLTGGGLASPLYLADGFTKRLEGLTTADDVIYGLTSDGVDHIFLPFGIALPGEDEGDAPRCDITIHNATREITAAIRGLTSPPSARLQVVIANADTTVSTPEIEFDGLQLVGITYNAEQVRGQLVFDGLVHEPFPAHTMTPSAFPGLF